MYRIASLHLAPNLKPVFVNVEMGDVEGWRWRDLCHVLGKAEGMMTVDADMTMHYFLEPPEDALMYGNPWQAANLEDTIDIRAGESVVVRLNLPTAHFKRRYIVKADKKTPKRRCNIS